MKPAVWRPLALLALLASLIACQDSRPELPVNTRLGGEFVLMDQQGLMFNSEDLRGNVVLMFFGFTHCPDICPATLARTVSTWKELGERERRNVKVVFVSFDSERDTPEHLRAYLAFFDPSVIGLTGNAEAIAEVAARYGVVYMQESAPETDPDNYMFAHSDFVYLLDTDGRVRKLFKSQFDPEEMLADVRSLL
jgi:protein SCO1